MSNQHEIVEQLTAELKTYSPAELIVLYHDEILNSLRTVVEAIGAGDIQTRYNGTAAACELIAQLHHSLDLERGGEVAHNLGRIYRFALNHLGQINLNNDAKPAVDAIEMFENLRSSWLKISARVSAGEIFGPDANSAFAGLGAQSDSAAVKAA